MKSQVDNLQQDFVLRGKVLSPKIANTDGELSEAAGLHHLFARTEESWTLYWTDVELLGGVYLSFEEKTRSRASVQYSFNH